MCLPVLLWNETGNFPCRSGDVGHHNHGQAKIRFLHPQNAMEENLAPGKVRVSPKGGPLPGSACSSVGCQGWLQASQFDKLHRITESLRLEKTSKAESNV